MPALWNVKMKAVRCSETSIRRCQIGIHHVKQSGFQSPPWVIHHVKQSGFQSPPWESQTHFITIFFTMPLGQTGFAFGPCFTHRCCKRRYSTWNLDERNSKRLIFYASNRICSSRSWAIWNPLKAEMTGSFIIIYIVNLSLYVLYSSWI